MCGIAVWIDAGSRRRRGHVAAQHPAASVSSVGDRNTPEHEDAQLETLEDAQEHDTLTFNVAARSSRVRLAASEDSMTEEIESWLRHRLTREWWPAVIHTLWLHRRGPDQCQTTLVALPAAYTDAAIHLSAAVLALRLPLMPQPSLLSQSYLAYNGELYDAPVTSGVAAMESDTTRVHQLFDAAAALSDVTEPPSRVFNHIQSTWESVGEVEGAWILVQPSQGRVLFAKDGLGRRSLLRGKLTLSHECVEHPMYAQIVASGLLQQMCLISSVALPGFTIPGPHGDLHVDTQWTEVDPHHIHGVLLEPEAWRIVRAPIRSAPLLAHPSRAFVLDDVVSKCLSLLQQSVRRRVSFLGSVPALGVLFSGGLDSSVLAALADDHLPSDIHIDLLNVAFGNSSDDCERAADRIAARQSYRELCERSRAAHRLRLILVNVTSDMMKQTMEHVQHLTLPLNTVMDASIAMPLWYAAQGEGVRVSDGERVRSVARVVLLGAGADEQFGGYSRHRVAFTREGSAGLISELEKDMARIWQRNLGRDDRVVADHGREARFPFLDRDLRDWLGSLPVESICDMNLPPGHGDKLLLRSVARGLSLPTASALVKRAVQFGSRLTKMVPKGKGTDKLDHD